MNRLVRALQGHLFPALLLVSIATPAADAMTGDAKRGARLAQPCDVCHGQQGQGSRQRGYPRLAGQNASYITKQLQDYISGQRVHPVMTILAKTYGAQQRQDVAAYFASLRPPPLPMSFQSDGALLARGRLLARTGDESRQLQACGNCHGPEGSGEPYAAPYLAGQSATYLTNAINEWKSGARKNDGGQQMLVVAERLDDRDIAAIAAYFELLGYVGS
jgi:cytochrome c553